MSKEDRYFPTLRFPEFSNLQGWKERKLHEVLFEHKQKSTGTEEVFSVSVHKGVINQIEHLGRSFSAANTDHYKRVLPGDVIYTKSPTGDFPYGIIKQSKVATAVIVSPLYGVFKPETVAVGYLLDSYFESVANTTNYLSSIVQKGAKNTINIHNDTFLSKGLILPDNQEEQQKIADCLSSLDDVINAQTQKLDLLRAHKKGLMQDLFPAEGESVPRLRFSGFEGEWDKRLLGEIGCFVGGGTPDTTIDEYWNGDISWFTPTEIKNGVLGTSIRKITAAGLKNSSAKLLPVGAILITTRATIGDVAITDFECTTNQGFQSLIVYETEYNRFWYYWLIANKQELIRRSSGSTFKEIGKNEISVIAAWSPKKAEQQKIADCLSSLDDQIQAQTQKIECLKLHKKGLMQQLFPK